MTCPPYSSSRRRFLRTLPFAGAVALPSCWQGSPNVESGPQEAKRPPLQVTTTHSILAELVGKLTGAPQAVRSLLARGERLAQLKRTGPRETLLISAEVIVTLGWGVEAELTDSLKKAQEAGAVLVELAAHLSADQLLPLPGANDQVDPSVWMDPELWKQTIAPLQAVFKSLRPEESERLNTNGHSMRFELETLQRRLAERVAAAPTTEQPRRVTTLQAPARYLARRIGVEVEVAEPSISQRSDWLENLKLDTLLPLGSDPGSSQYESHDLTKVEGLVECTAALLLEV